MVNHKYKCIFVHIPRTSGTSIESEFGFDMDFKDGKKSINPYLPSDSDKHLKASEIFNSISKDLWGDYFKFTIVRNPWDRVISIFHMPAFGDINALSKKSLSYFLSHYQPKPQERGVQCMDYIDRADLDFIGKFENRQQDTNFIFKKIGFLGAQNMHNRKTNHKHYTEYYDDETRQIVAERYAKDIEYFGYKFGE